MYLKSLEMQGFKSFPDKTKLIFDAEGALVNPTGKGSSDPGQAGHAAGVTVIVGPNGSGKSNISDAMRWVLGEISSKSLRGSKMEDVIFGGADSRKPMGYAEVSVTFDNSDPQQRLDCPYDEVTVTRRYYRAGESEYFINRRAVRLRDIYELFMNTGIGRDGYSIIGQGRIAEMVSRKSEDRRAIFEDASGIAKYRHKKNEAERKLAQTEDNMTRVRDIFSVIEAQVEPLAKESARAKKAIELMETKKQADVSLWLYDTERLRRELDVAEENLNHSTFDLERAEEAVASMEEQNNRLFEQSQSNKMNSEELLTQIRRLTEEIHALDSDYRVKESKVGHTRELIAAAQGSIESTDRSMQLEIDGCTEHHQKIAALRDAAQLLTEEQSALLSEQKEVRERVEVLEANIATAQEDILALDARATDIKVRLSVIENARENDDGKNDSMRSELDNYVQIATGLDQQCTTLRATIADYNESLASLESQTDELHASLNEQREAFAQQSAQLNAANLRAESLTQRINTYRTMEEHFEGYANSVRYVMNQYAQGKITDAHGAPCGTIYGPLSQLISVDDRYITAIETALGANLQNIVVDNENTAKSAMYALKRGEAGRATFFPLTSMRASSETNEMRTAAGYEGYIDVADKLIHADAKFTNVLSSLLGRTVIFDNIDHATVMAKATGYRVRVVTLDGQQINVGGSFTGGSVKQKGGVLSRAGEIKRMEGDLAELKKEITAQEKAVRTLEKQIEEIEISIDELDNQKGLTAVLRASEAAQLEQVLAKRDANSTLMEKLRAEYEEIAQAHARYEEELATLHAEETALRTQIEEIRAARQSMDEQRNDLEDRADEIEKRLTELYVRISANEKDSETEHMLIRSAEERIDAFSAQLQALRERMAEYQRQISELTEQMEMNREVLVEGQAKLDGLNARRKLVEEDGFAFEKKLNELNRKMREKMDEKEQIFRVHTKNETKLAQLRAEQDKLSGKLWEDYELTRADALALGYPAVTAENRMSVLATQTECRHKLRGMGNVDLDAVEKYKEVKEKYDTMSAQIEDLEKSRKELTGIIESLEKDMKVSFVECFNQINENFGRVFAELFGGGSAELSLTDPENILESGIEIKAAPPGKIIKNLMQLSGGEQSFIGVALFFAILQANPTPFCILDEIEAALDEVNVERLAQYIKRYSAGTQFIMITHRRGTMAAATRLYGVTMPEHGISKVLALDVENISKKKGDDWDGIFG